MKTGFILLLTLFVSQSSFPVDFSIKMNPNPAAPLTAIATILNTRADSVSVKFHSEGHSFVYGRKYKETFPVIGLKTNRIYKVSFDLYLKGRKYKSSSTYKIQTPELPADPAMMPKIVVTTVLQDKMENGYTLFNPRREAPRTNSLDDSFNQAYGMLMAIDHSGDVVWWFSCGSRISDFDILDNGNVSFLQQDNTLVEIDWAGNIVNSWFSAIRSQKKGSSAIPVSQQTMHHDVTRVPNGNFVALGTEWRELKNYWTNDTTDVKSTQKVMGDIVYEFNSKGEVVWTWNVFDYLNPYVAGYETFHAYWQRRGYPDVRADWSHANAVVYDKSSDALLVNFRHLSLILKIDRRTGNIVWAFGHHTDVLNDKSKYITLERGEFPWHQHAPEITSRGTLLFFNNDNYKAFIPSPAERVQDSYSYANEYAINEKSLTAREVWSSRQRNDQYLVSVAMGDVDNLPRTGNILVAYGQLLDREYLPKMKSWNDRKGTSWTMMREYTHDNPAEIVWEVQLKKLNDHTNIGWTLFGAERFTYK